MGKARWKMDRPKTGPLAPKPGRSRTIDQEPTEDTGPAVEVEPGPGIKPIDLAQVMTKSPDTADES